MKKPLSFLLSLFILLAAIPCFSIQVHAESTYIRKIVSVVYDDSGSMEGDKWAYANYAMQAFCGMLNSEDQLFITYMSGAWETSYEPEKIDLSADGIQASVDSIRSHTDTSSTPYTSVEIAFDKLRSVDDSNQNTQYWLVVITDGFFDEMSSMSEEDQEDFLDDYFDDYTDTVMPNGTTPQITFLGIGDYVTFPDETESVHTYAAQNAEEIIEAMSEMADSISGRTRLEESDIQKTEENTIQVSSSIPLLNIVVFSQESDAKIESAIYNNEIDIPISREADLNYPGYSNLVGEAYLLGDSQNAIGSGSYVITFDQEVDLEDLVILFEPALEVRLIITLNGEEISDYSELDDAEEGDIISVSCKIYEMGTDTEIDSSLLPPGTTYEISVSEDGKVVEEATGEEMLLSDYVLSSVETEITASVVIEGFNPIERSKKFTPSEKAQVYTIACSYADDVRSVRYDGIANNEDFAVLFTVYADGTALTDAASVKALNPTISVSPQGNSGNVTYADDGTIVYTPNAASASGNEESFEVEVTCTLSDGTSAAATYTVLIADYRIVATDADDPVRKHEFYGNDVSVSFYITKDGTRLTKAEVESGIAIALNEEHADLLTDIEVASDGTVTVTPYDAEEHILNFASWWTNWYWYFGISAEDVEVTLSHAYGSATAGIEVLEADTAYLILCVAMPLLLEILFVAAVIAYIVRYVTKPRFAGNAALYVGSITRTGTGAAGRHNMELREVRLRQFNKFKYLWNPFKELTVSVCGVSITAVNGNRIRCNLPFPWYSGAVRPVAHTVIIQSPKDVVTYCQVNDELQIHEIKPTAVMDGQNRVIVQDGSVYYFARADTRFVPVGNRQMEVIEGALAFCYSIIQN